jgi:hypothetical protein
MSGDHSPDEGLRPWIKGEYVLSLKSFPSTTMLRLRNGRKTGQSYRNCTCGKYHSHRGVLDLLKEVVVPFVRDRGNNDWEFPPVKVCFNAANIWEDKIPVNLTGAEAPMKLEDLPTMECVSNALFTSTYWYGRATATGGKHRSERVNPFLKLISGYRGDSWSVLKTLPPTKEGWQRLKNVLATVDGVLVQLMLGFANREKMWKWSTYDQITNCLVRNLVTDYLREKDYTGPLYYADLKKIRGLIKFAGFQDGGKVELEPTLLRKMSFFIPLLDSISKTRSPMNMVAISLLSQTRAAGTPPAPIKEQSLKKWVETVSQPSSLALYEELKDPLIGAIDKYYNEVVSSFPTGDSREQFLRGCQMSSKISLSDSAEINHSSNLGGKLEAVRALMSQTGAVNQVDLDTGKDSGKVLTLDEDPLGEMIFHHCLGRWKNSSPYANDKMSIRVAVVPELGKYRTITVGSIEHAVLLHPMSHIGLKFLEASASSASGVAAANQAWEFFRRLSGANPAASFIFEGQPKNLWIMSTDWETSTDWCDHYIARAILNRFMWRLGYPKWYREQCVFALTAPRLVREPLKEGKPWLTSKGVLMGDPGTKTILTLYHPIARNLAMKTLVEECG